MILASCHGEFQIKRIFTVYPPPTPTRPPQAKPSSPIGHPKRSQLTPTPPGPSETDGNQQGPSVDPGNQSNSIAIQAIQLQSSNRRAIQIEDERITDTTRSDALFG